ncbi:caspase family protein [uncultured Tateyamaria sp.]|uniref:caspase family protein n=1 Tax=uncultured Tateyamaria sp. TaxID=455651 RepID=UPI002622F5BE|nr:caspase family protein [uncultured Tateyamaria sp.]
MRILSLLLFVLAGLAPAAWAEERIALIIGNSQYSSVAPLNNAVNDAEIMSETLRAVGFDVTLVVNSTQIDLKRAIAQFGRRLRAGGRDTVGLFYYAGHGVQSFGSNYLLPVDASLSDAADLDLVAFEASSVLRQMASARNRTNIVILDACRNNPFEDIADLNDNGLAEMKAPTGTYLAYATAPGAVAFDGVGENSPYTAALAEAIQTEGAPIEAVFKQVRVAVLEKTSGAQTPWDTSSLTQDFVFRAGRQLTPDEVAEQQLWNSVSQSSDPVQIMLFLRSYPDGMFATDARAALTEALQDELSGGAAPVVESAPEPKPEAPVSVTPAPPPDLEMQLMETARASGLKKDYEAYLAAFPEGVFAELVKIEIAGIEANATQDPDAGNQIAAAAPPAETAPAPAPQRADPLPVVFDQPMPEGIAEIRGKTILEAANGSPLFAPIDGLPEALWKDQQCSSCHQWTRDALCTQAMSYLTTSTTRALEKQHPYGGSFKRNLRTWAQGDCQ